MNMTKRRKWESSQKLKIVLEGLSGQIEISKLCNKYQISQVIYYRWREQLLQYGQEAFESKNITKREQRLQSENQRLKQIIGDLTIELKKSEFE
jgi:transposase-like protein